MTNDILLRLLVTNNQVAVVPVEYNTIAAAAGVYAFQTVQIGAQKVTENIGEIKILGKALMKMPSRRGIILVTTRRSSRFSFGKGEDGTRT